MLVKVEVEVFMEPLTDLILDLKVNLQHFVKTVVREPLPIIREFGQASIFGLFVFQVFDNHQADAGELDFVPRVLLQHVEFGLRGFSFVHFSYHFVHKVDSCVQAFDAEQKPGVPVLFLLWVRQIHELLYELNVQFK